MKYVLMWLTLLTLYAIFLSHEVYTNEQTARNMGTAIVANQELLLILAEKLGL